MKTKIISLKEKADRLPKNGVGIIEWVLFVVSAIISYVFFCHPDILVTAGHSIEYLNGNILNFYSACTEVDGDYCANYLPSTFVVFAIWNIPIKLLGLAPEYIGDWSVAFAMWNKLLPTIFFLLSGWVLKKLVSERFGFDNKKANLTVFLMFTAPTAFFSQFLFCQYDIFTVFFMLLGMYFYFKEKPTKKDWFLFILFFGVATTFKYFALLIFAVLLLVRVKDIFKCLVSLFGAVLPVAVEAGFYLLTDRKAFVKSVFDFAALDYSEGFMIDLGDVSINGLYAVLILIIAFSYFTKTKSFEDLVSYSIFYSCGICFALFGLMLWHPQWVLFMAPFWAIGTMINKNYKIFLWLDLLMGLAFIIYIVNQFEFALQNVIRYGLFIDELRYKQVPTLTMSDLLIFKDADTLYTVISAILLIGFIFRHPKFNFKKINTGINDCRFIINVRFLAFILVFFVVDFATLPNFMERPDMLWKLSGGEGQEYVAVTDEKTVTQYTMLDEMTVDKVYVVADKIVKEEGESDEIIAEKKETEITIFVNIIDTETGKIEASGSAKVKNIKDGAHKYTKIDLPEDFTPEQDKLYAFEYFTDSDLNTYMTVEISDASNAYYVRTKQYDYSSSYCEYSESDIGEKQLVMQLLGEAE